MVKVLQHLAMATTYVDRVLKAKTLLLNVIKRRQQLGQEQGGFGRELRQVGDRRVHREGPQRRPGVPQEDRRRAGAKTFKNFLLNRRWQQGEIS